VEPAHVLEESQLRGIVDFEVICCLCCGVPTADEVVHAVNDIARQEQRSAKGLRCNVRPIPPLSDCRTLHVMPRHGGACLGGACQSSVSQVTHHSHVLYV
jgi:hypothetical protein